MDGVETEAVTVCGVMIGVRLAPGRHTVTFSYHNDALRQGITVSLVALAVFLGLSALTYLPWKRENSSAVDGLVHQNSINWPDAVCSVHVASGLFFSPSRGWKKRGLPQNKFEATPLGRKKC